MTLQDFKTIICYGDGQIAILYNGYPSQVMEIETQERLIGIWDEFSEEIMWVRYENCALMPENPADLNSAKKESKRILAEFMSS